MDWEVLEALWRHGYDMLGTAPETGPGLFAIPASLGPRDTE